jgi:hypothetical protein
MVMADSYFKVTCPYCDAQFETPGPSDKSLTCDYVCMPYTRDVGQFDPKSKEEWFSPRGWTRIGSDYLSWLNFERIGILRLSAERIDVRYRVQVCKQCERFFDVYANYTAGKKLEQIWPHLFGKEPNDDQAIRPYFGVSWMMWLVRKIDDKLRSSFLGVIAVGFFLIVLGLISFGLAYHISLLDLLSAQLPPLPLVEYRRLGLYITAVLGVISILILEDRYLRYIESTRDFEKLFRLTAEQIKSGLVYWRNFTLARFIGVQTPGKPPKLTQVDVFSGGLAILLLMIVWSIFHPQEIEILVVIPILILLGLALGSRSQSGSNQRNDWLKVLLIGGSLFVILALVVWRWISTTANWHQQIMSSGLDLFFWCFVTYFLGTAAFLSMNTTLYVLQGMSHIPMKINPLDQYAQAKPLRRLQVFSTQGLVVLFLIILVLTFLLYGLNSYAWLLEWMRWGVALIFAAIGFALRKGEYLGLALLYVVLSIFLNQTISNSFPLLAVPVNMFTMGVFFTALVGFQIVRTDGCVNGVLADARDEVVARLLLKIQSIQEQLDDIDELLVHQHGTASQEGAILLEQRKSALESIESLLRIKDRILDAPVKTLRLQRIAEFLAPVLTSLLLPLFSEISGQFLTSQVMRIISTPTPYP